MREEIAYRYISDVIAFVAVVIALYVSMQNELKDLFFCE